MGVEALRHKPIPVWTVGSCRWRINLLSHSCQPLTEHFFKNFIYVFEKQKKGEERKDRAVICWLILQIPTKFLDYTGHAEAVDNECSSSHCADDRTQLLQPSVFPDRFSTDRKRVRNQSLGWTQHSAKGCRYLFAFSLDTHSCMFSVLDSWNTGNFDSVFQMCYQ